MLQSSGLFVNKKVINGMRTKKSYANQKNWNSFASLCLNMLGIPANTNCKQCSERKGNY
jgi:hypothetical protein